MRSSPEESEVAVMAALVCQRGSRCQRPSAAVDAVADRVSPAWQTFGNASLCDGRAQRARLQRPYLDLLRLGDREPIAQRQAERFRFDLEPVAFLARDPLAERERRGAEIMHVDVPRAAEQGVLEMVRLEVGDGVRHVLLAGKERLLPDDRLAAADARDALDVEREVADQELGAEARRAQLGMGEGEIVLPLRDVIGEFVAEREADPHRRALRIDHIDADNLRLLAAVERETRADEIAAGRGERRTVALVEPLGLHPRGALARLAALEAHLEHSHR